MAGSTPPSWQPRCGWSPSWPSSRWRGCRSCTPALPSAAAASAACQAVPLCHMHSSILFTKFCATPARVTKRWTGVVLRRNTAIRAMPASNFTLEWRATAASVLVGCWGVAIVRGETETNGQWRAIVTQSSLAKCAQAADVSRIRRVAATRVFRAKPPPPGA
jgi:hypothetical protein